MPINIFLASPILNLISSAAALVKVINTIFELSSTSFSSCLVLSTKHAVFPEPLLAITTILFSLASITAFCSLLNAIVLSSIFFINYIIN